MQNDPKWFSFWRNTDSARGGISRTWVSSWGVQPSGPPPVSAAGCPLTSKCPQLWMVSWWGSQPFWSELPQSVFIIGVPDGNQALCVGCSEQRSLNSDFLLLILILLTISSVSCRPCSHVYTQKRMTPGDETHETYTKIMSSAAVKGSKTFQRGMSYLSIFFPFFYSSFSSFPCYSPPFLPPCVSCLLWKILQALCHLGEE